MSDRKPHERSYRDLRRATARAQRARLADVQIDADTPIGSESTLYAPQPRTRVRRAR